MKYDLSTTYTAYLYSLYLYILNMNKAKRITLTVIGVMGILMYWRRDMHRWYFVNVEGRPIE